MEDRLSFSKIHIIEWLKPANGKTGTCVTTSSIIQRGSKNRVGTSL